MVLAIVLIPAMNQNKLFAKTRLKLAIWYAGVMGLILSLCGFGLYHSIVHAHWQTLDRELETVTGTLHDSIEIKLKQPGRLEPTAQELLPEKQSQRHVLGAIYQGNYYVRLLNLSEQVVATAGFEPVGLPVTSPQTIWQTLEDAQGNRYHQISVTLHTQDNQDWGYMQMGRSLKDLDDYVQIVKLSLLLGLPMAMILVGGSSWWLAGLAMQPIYKSYRQIEQFTADAAHELRTPLAASQATVESALLLPQLEAEEARDILTTIGRQNQRLTALVADLLLLSRMDRQPSPLRRQMCCLNDIVGDLVEELMVLAIASQITLKLHLKVSTQVYVVGDEDQLYRLVSNLIVNGIQYTPPGGSVTVTLDSSDSYAVIEVEDTGIGILLSEQKRIFDRFYRINTDRSRSTGGSGLGLAIAGAIAQAHGGSIQVRSVLGKGSSFIVRLPKFDV